MSDEKLEEFEKLEADIGAARSRSEGLKRYSLAYLIWQAENIKSESFKKEVDNLNEEVESLLKSNQASLESVNALALENTTLEGEVKNYIKLNAQTNKIAQLALDRHIKTLSFIEEMSGYLDHGHGTSITSFSGFHSRMKSVLMGL